MINREEAFILLKKYLRKEDNIRYSMAVEAILRVIAKKIQRDEELWGLTGLLHNLDYEYTENEPEKRGILSAQLLENLLPENAIYAIKANNYLHSDNIPTTSLDKSLIAVDAVVGLIIITKQLMPSKKIVELDFKTLINKFLDITFVPDFNRNKIQLCEDIGIEIEAFLDLSLNTLKQISEKINF